ncbi:hypothetical protein Cgig2_033469 [Carnegiea gigantea]|uniref:Uncharacterized protein n=1 Tax=Carnegiea gigantea TaxID=171969 RepID=A0A9Q1GSJ6_9CARY|nr:hypothetical protein Cgig2_033469 [Carnegiea gigantea]
MKGVETLSLSMEKRWVFPLIISSAVCIFLIATSFNMGLLSSLHTLNAFFSHYHLASTNETSPVFVESVVAPLPLPPPPPPLPRFAYLISGSKGDLEKLWRVLLACYHPRNQYIVHLDLESPPEERLELAARVEHYPLFASAGNVFMNTKANIVTYRGPTMVSNTLHACAILLKRSKDWDWFINLSASDYPLVTQDGKEFGIWCLTSSPYLLEPAMQCVTAKQSSFLRKAAYIEPLLASSRRWDIYLVVVLVAGSAWMVLSHEFVEYLIWGWDNLPRTLLMYYTNFVSSPEGYFHTVICNVPKFAQTAVNHDLHYISWDVPPRQHPQTLNMNHTSRMIAGNAAFARKFKQDDPVLDKIDMELLGRRNGSVTPGRWCAGKPRCARVGNHNKVKKGPGAKRLGRLISGLLSPKAFKANQCK